MFLSRFGGPNDGSIEDHHVLLIDGQPVFDTCAIFLKENRGEFDKGIHRFRIRPTTNFVQFVGEIEVIHRNDGFDAVS